MTVADPRMMADVLDRLATAGFAVALAFGGDLILRAKPAAPAQGEPFSDGTQFDDGTGWAVRESREP